MDLEKDVSVDKATLVRQQRDQYRKKLEKRREDEINERRKRHLEDVQRSHELPRLVAHLFEQIALLYSDLSSDPASLQEMKVIEILGPRVVLPKRRFRRATELTRVREEHTVWDLEKVRGFDYFYVYLTKEGTIIISSFTKGDADEYTLTPARAEALKFSRVTDILELVDKKRQQLDPSNEG